MTPLDRLAWRCSWAAPAAFIIAIAVVVVDATFGVARTANRGLRDYLPIAALAIGAVGLVAHLVVHYHAVRPGSFRPNVDRLKLDAALRFMGYSTWRELMRAEHPELRSSTSHNGYTR